MKPDACSIGLFNEDHVLLIQRAFPPYAGYWTFPGGRIEPHETPIECVKRELFEETRLIVTNPVPVLVETVGEGAKTYTLAVFADHVTRAAPFASPELLDWDWVHIDEVQAYRTTKNLAEIIQACADCLSLVRAAR